MDKTYIPWDDFHKDCDITASQIISNNFKPDYMICLARGGVVPGRIIAEHVEPKRFLTLGLKLYNNQTAGSNVEVTQGLGSVSAEFDRHDNILIVDDLSDKGTTLRFAYSYIFRASGGAHIATACPYIKTGTSMVPTYYHKEFSSEEWLVFPFEKD